MNFRFIALFVWLLHASIGSANAANVHLNDGSIIIGSIISLTDGEDLIVDTAHMDEVVIEWGSVDRILNTEVLDIELFDGKRYAGQLSRTGDDVEISGDSLLQISADDVYEIQEFAAGVWDGISADTSLGMNLVRGNNQVTQISFGMGVGFENQDFQTRLRGATILNEQVDAGDTRRTTLTGSYAHKYTNGWQAYGRLQYESDEQQGLDGRTLLAGAIGKRVHNQRRHRVEVFAGLALNSERFSGLATNETLEGLVGSSYRMRSFVDIDSTLLVFPSLEDSDRVRAQFDATLSFDLYSALDFQITVYDRYDSQPPVGNDKNDVGVTLGLSWDY